jgi:hypothetical protein
MKIAIFDSCCSIKQQIGFIEERSFDITMIIISISAANEHLLFKYIGPQAMIA